ncbi:von Willebrand factor D and EGF domain-containing protein-like [Mercenaria mercenaria]|uniref:von Willebrand factor D and EGF domain-containing protein-like n=1 Tax=Mercenaria mercenaria TaxID=6596 RepID=UPI00234E67AB|nr:von Willebrand factor D and EGF domain-containing protein-like [Mercenaria mercenaria]
MDGTVAYRVNWYINGTLWIKTGPSFEAEDLVFKGESLNELRLGYQVKCGVIAVGTNGSSESFSDDFYAGWKISDTSLKLSKNGHAFVEVEQTVPLGCAHTVTGQEKCEEMLSLEDPKQTPDVACKAGIHVLNADDDSGDLSYHKIKSLKIGEKWNENKKYRFRLSTIDHNYDDKLYFEMKLLVTMTTRQTPRVHSGRDTLLISTIQVVVTNSEVNRNKRCYSHVDPHMRTADGRYYEQQREGDHMLYRNLAYQTEVQEYARYCNQDYTNGPVCACGVAIRSGADVFMINRCGNFTFLDFKECGDGGILDVERVHDYHYKVTTPIGTIVDISLHRWGKTMNIDIYLSAKDFGNMDGLCGYFDGDNTNDFRHRDGVTVSNGNNDYAFSNSWRLSDEENFLKNDNRLLEKWKKNNGGNRPCSRPESITKNKCKFERRKRREVIVRKGKEKSRQEIMPVAEKIREKRSTGYDISDEKARTICNSSIYEAPAVRDFSDKLADEDPEVVLSQCVYDIVQGNDTVWAGAHVNALNNIATSVISLNPAFAASNSVSVKKFLSQTCLNNCSGHGECSEIGLCTCGGNFRGPDCGIDLRIPPIIYDIQDGGMCDTANDSECDCFVIRTDNIFEGFTYEIDTYELLFDGTRKQIGKSVNVGEYEDVFTGVCCIPEQRKKRSVDDSSDPSIMRFDVVISNDGNNFGQSKSVYVFDSTCVHFEHSGGIVTIVLKDGYCFIGGACVEQKSTLQTPSGCYVCEPKSIPYAWKHVSCGRDNAGLATSTLAAVITGSVFAGIILMALVVYVRCFKGSKKLRTVEDIQTSQAYMSPGPAKKFLGYKWMSPNREMTE